MPLFHINKTGKLEPIKEKGFKLEKDIQQLTEDNLATVFGLQLVRSEFAFKDLRIDTLAYDQQAKAFVIIEYKKSKNFSVIDQGYAYLALMLNNKADFILEYNENLKDTLKKNDVDWTQSRIIFVSPSFSHYQQEAINFKDLPIELWEIKKYENQTVSFNKLETSGAEESIKTLSPENETFQKVSEEISVFTEEDHLNNTSDDIRELYEQYKSAILNLDDMEIKPMKKYIAFVSGNNIVDVHLQKKQMKMWLNLKTGELDDPKGSTRDVSNVGHWGNGSYELVVNDTENMGYIMDLVKQVLRKYSGNYSTIS